MEIKNNLKVGGYLEPYAYTTVQLATLTPEEGAIAYDKDKKCFMVYAGNGNDPESFAWKRVTPVQCSAKIEINDSTDLTINYNQTTDQEISFSVEGLASQNSDILEVSLTDNAIIVKEAGRYRVDAMIRATSAATARALLDGYIMAGTTQITARDSTYIRNQNGHTRDSIVLVGIAEIAADAEIQVMVGRSEGATTEDSITLLEGTFLAVTKIG